MTTIAKLNDQGRLVGLRKLGKKAKAPDGAIVVTDECDLPTDGTYYWHKEEKCFFPLGHGHGRPGPAPCSPDFVLFQLAMRMANPPQEVLEWIEWMKELDKQ